MRICKAESGLRQWDDYGRILQGVVNHEDLGFCQINAKYHMEEAMKAGLDIFTAEGNILFAKWLYDKKGTSPWKASEKEWGDS